MSIDPIIKYIEIMGTFGWSPKIDGGFIEL